MPPPQSTFFSPTELDYLYSCLAQQIPIRPDARSANAFRPLIAEVDLLPTTNGSARLCFADGTEGIVGIKAEIARLVDVTDPSDFGSVSPVSGDWIEVSIDFPGQRDDETLVTSLGQMTHESLVIDHTLLQRLKINANWHWKLYVDILLLSAPASYPLPLISLTTYLALLSARLPAIVSQGGEDPLFNDDWEAATPLYPRRSHEASGKSSTALTNPPVSVTLISVGPNLFCDPSREELAVADAAVTVTLIPSSAAGAKVLAVRTLDPPATLTTSSIATLGGEPGFNESMDYGGQGLWKPKRGGIKREVLQRMIALCSKKGGIGEDVMNGMQRFVQDETHSC